jgi:hypothetical protein
MIVAEEHVQAFKKAWERKQIEQLGKIRVEGEKTRAGLEAVFALLSPEIIAHEAYELGYNKGWDHAADTYY